MRHGHRSPAASTPSLSTLTLRHLPSRAKAVAAGQDRLRPAGPTTMTSLPQWPPWAAPGRRGAPGADEGSSRGPESSSIAAEDRGRGRSSPRSPLPPPPRPRGEEGTTTQNDPRTCPRCHTRRGLMSTTIGLGVSTRRAEKSRIRSSIRIRPTSRGVGAPFAIPPTPAVPPTLVGWRRPRPRAARWGGRTGGRLETPSYI